MSPIYWHHDKPESAALGLAGGTASAILIQTLATLCFFLAAVFVVMTSSSSVISGTIVTNSSNNKGKMSMSIMAVVRIAIVGSLLMLCPLLSSVYQTQNCTMQLRQGVGTGEFDLPQMAASLGLSSGGSKDTVVLSNAKATKINDEDETTKRDRIPQGNETITTKPTRVGSGKKTGGINAKYHYSCHLQTKPQHHKTLARIILLQRDGRRQLRDFVTHYTRVLPYNSLVIMDHEGNDNYTKSLLQDYGELGAHIWRCEGSFKAKAAMWSQVTQIYAQDSGFVFPVDVDELLAVKQKDGHGLQWSSKALKDALGSLGKSGKPYKMNWIESVPSECHVHMTNVQLRKPREGMHASEMCDIQFVKTKEIGCMDKTFSRGAQFHKTDTGNHYGGTRRFPDLSKALCEEKGLTNVYEISTLALIHLKEKTFEDWLVHGMRGATDRGFNRNMDIDCDKVQQSLHYCKKWEKITKARFSPYELRKVYVDDVCPQTEDVLMPVHDTFCFA
ncbi:expressed unknown protein [Seminavis robusta]|uniref:Uncharacterized protein n=1 Tax=Seminavis robusta TaxID=568900 RepID=A0A9N8EGK1_9STRA|nr:expressed unknown protein [Seminavis robusta]|eukprot:Sro1049_g235440.1 n/a (502) ;mRNA; r:33886-35391